MFINTSMSLGISICIFFISPMQSVSCAYFLNTTSSFLLFMSAAVPVFGTEIVP